MLMGLNIHYDSFLAAVLLPPSKAAFCFGKHVFVRGGELSLAKIRHEKVHYYQWLRYGWFHFFLLYAYYQIRYGYERNPLEIEARKAEGECRGAI